MLKLTTKVNIITYLDTQIEEFKDVPKPLGKYITDMNAEDEAKMDVWEQKMLEPYLEVYKLVNWDDYNLEKMNDKFRRERVL